MKINLIFMLKKTRLYSILFNKCPRCHEGDFFVTNNPYDFKKFDEMNKQCSHCGESFMKEVGFYYGAMYVSYALTIAIGVALYVILDLMLGFSEIVFLISFCITALLLWTWIFRKARLVWINFFVHYNKEEKEAERMKLG